jgi:hypothetical protein
MWIFELQKFTRPEIDTKIHDTINLPLRKYVSNLKL